jgi:hypothetical protein
MRFVAEYASGQFLRQVDASHLAHVPRRHQPRIMPQRAIVSPLRMPGVGQMRRREFLGAFGRAVVAWPLSAHAQQVGGMRRVGVLMNLAADDPEGQARVTAFVQSLQELGLTAGRNLQIDYRWDGSGGGAVHRSSAGSRLSKARKLAVFLD